MKRKRTRFLLKSAVAMSMAFSAFTPLFAQEPEKVVLTARVEPNDQTGRSRGASLVSTIGTMWNGKDDLVLYFDARDGSALDTETFKITKGADKVEIRDGRLVVKEGAVLEENEQIVVEATSHWYDTSQLYWFDDLELDGSLTPSQAGKYCLKHSKTMARHGAKAGTTVHENVKDGMWSPSISGEGTLVFWYYDPCTEEEMDTQALAALASPAVDQGKFGMAINNYPDFLLGTAIPASGDKGADGKTMTKEQRLEYTKSYVLRYGGNWRKTNIARSKGWHRMAAEVSANGTTVTIDGTPVIAEGDSEQTVISALKSISKVAVATNWGDKAQTMQFIEDKHFIDDIYVIKPGEQAHETTQSMTITVGTPTAQEDRAAVEKTLAALEAMDFGSVRQSSAPDQAAAQALILARARAVAEPGVNVTMETVSYTAPKAAGAASAGENGEIVFVLHCQRNLASGSVSEKTMVIEADPYVQTQMKIASDEEPVLAKGESRRFYLDGAQSYGVDSIAWTTDNENVTVDGSGNVSIRPGYSPKAGETVRVKANVSYIAPEDVVFADSFEGDRQFNGTTYVHSDTRSLFGKQAATASGNTNGYPAADLGSLSDVRVSAWYYDANGNASQTKFGIGINGNSTALGVFYDSVIAPYVNNMTMDHYGNRISGFTYRDYAWGTTDAPRSEGWHHFEWIIDSEKGLTEKVDGQIVSTNSAVGKTGTNHELVPAENLASVTELKNLVLMTGWNNNANNMAEIADRHFIDGVYVAPKDAQMHTIELESAPIALQGASYTVTPASLSVNSTYPDDQMVRVAPYSEGDTDIVSVLIDGQAADEALWSAGMQTAPENAANYPEELKGYGVSLSSALFEGLEPGSHELKLVTLSNDEILVEVNAEAEEHTAQSYYLSAQGDDANDGHSPQSAWQSFDKLESVTFGPGDTIYLDAQSTWNNVQFSPKGSGAKGAPVVMTRYNTNGDNSARPVLNGDGTVADFDGHSYLAFDAWRSFYPSGTIELFNVENWEVRDLEITNYASQMKKGAVGRNGIAVIYDYFESQGLTSLPSSYAEKEKAFYRAGKLQHIVIDNCYVHDVTGYHPANGAQGRGGKMSGGINVYGPYDDLQICNNIVMYCDVEGIRNDVLAWMGDTRTQFPAYMKDVRIANNYIAGVPGDGIVISSAYKPVIENNYLTDAGYSYFAASKSNTAGVSWNASDLNSCRNVNELTNTTVRAMGNRKDPITMGATNFAGLWFIGTKDAVAQYNEASNNVWTCNDGEAFDADMFCKGTIFQYNYTYRNNGGLCLFMPTMDEGTVLRYNISVEDGQSLGIAESQNGLFHYIGTPEAIHNNVFLLSDKLATIFGGESNTAYFYNNIVAAPNGLLSSGTYNGFHINGSSDGAVQNPALSGEIKNNLFCPSAILDSTAAGSSVVKENNVVLSSKEELEFVFEDLDGFMEAQPLHALAGRSEMSGESAGELEYGKGAGVAISAQDGKSIQTPAGGFDLDQFAGLRLKENSPALGAGSSTLRDYAYKAQNDAAWPLEKDFFENPIDSQEPMDIGVHQKSSESEHAHAFDQEIPDEKYLVSQADCTHPAVYKKSCLCGEAGEETFEYGEALGHLPVIDPAVEPTETEDGWTEGSHCGRCGEILIAQQRIPATGQTNHWKVLLSRTIAEAERIETAQDWSHVHPKVKAFFDQSLANARNLLADADASNEDLQKAWADLTKAIQMSGFTADKSALEALVRQAEAIDLSGIPEGAKKEAFTAALANAKAVLANEDALDETSIVPAYQQLAAAMEALEETGELNTLLLDLLISQAKEAIDNPQAYLDSCMEALRPVYSQALAVQANPQSQDEIDLAVSALHNAWLGMRLKADENLLKDLAGKAETLSALLSADLNDADRLAGEKLYADYQAFLAGEPEKSAAENLQLRMESWIASASSQAASHPARSEGRKNAASVDTSAKTASGLYAASLAAAAAALELMRRKRH